MYVIYIYFKNIDISVINNNNKYCCGNIGELVGFGIVD